MHDDPQNQDTHKKKFEGSGYEDASNKDPKKIKLSSGSYKDGKELVSPKGGYKEEKAAVTPRPIGALKAQKAGGDDRWPSVPYTGGATTLYHYTKEEGYKAIMSSQKLIASTGFKHARHGDGQYLSDIDPKKVVNKKASELTKQEKADGVQTLGQVSKKFYNDTRKTGNIKYFIGINVSSLDVRQGTDEKGNSLREGTLFVLGGDLNISDKIVDHGETAAS